MFGRSPPLYFTRSLHEVYEKMDAYWKDPEKQEVTKNILTLSLAGSFRDRLIESRLGFLSSSYDSHGSVISSLTTSMPGVWKQSDHQSIVWCNEVAREVVSLLYRWLRWDEASSSFQVTDPKTLFEITRTHVHNPFFHAPQHPVSFDPRKSLDDLGDVHITEAVFDLRKTNVNEHSVTWYSSEEKRTLLEIIPDPRQDRKTKIMAVLNVAFPLPVLGDYLEIIRCPAGNLNDLCERRKTKGEEVLVLPAQDEKDPQLIVRSEFEGCGTSCRFFVSVLQAPLFSPHQHRLWLQVSSETEPSGSFLETPSDLGLLADELVRLWNSVVQRLPPSLSFSSSLSLPLSSSLPSTPTRRLVSDLWVRDSSHLLVRKLAVKTEKGERAFGTVVMWDRKGVKGDENFHMRADLSPVLLRSHFFSQDQSTDSSLTGKADPLHVMVVVDPEKEHVFEWRVDLFESLLQFGRNYGFLVIGTFPGVSFCIVLGMYLAQVSKVEGSDEGQKRPIDNNSDTPSKSLRMKGESLRQNSLSLSFSRFDLLLSLALLSFIALLVALASVPEEIFHESSDRDAEPGLLRKVLGLMEGLLTEALRQQTIVWLLSIIISSSLTCVYIHIFSLVACLQRQRPNDEENSRKSLILKVVDLLDLRHLSWGSLFGLAIVLEATAITTDHFVVLILCLSRCWITFLGRSQKENKEENGKKREEKLSTRESKSAFQFAVLLLVQLGCLVLIPRLVTWIKRLSCEPLADVIVSSEWSSDLKSLENMEVALMGLALILLTLLFDRSPNLAFCSKYHHVLTLAGLFTSLFCIFHFYRLVHIITSIAFFFILILVI